MGLFCVYKHTAPNGKVYIGITSKKPIYRWNNGKAYWQNKHFNRAINHYGWENFTHEVLLTGLTKEEACLKERELIAYYKSNKQEYGYNRSIGGEHPNEGADVSEETRFKHSLARKGKKMPPEYGEAISRGKKGRSNGLNGRKGKECMKSGVLYQIDEATGEAVNLFYGYDEMARITGYAKTPVRETATGIRKRAYGFLWRYEKRGTENVTV